MIEMLKVRLLDDTRLSEWGVPEETDLGIGNAMVVVVDLMEDWASPAVEK